MTDYTPIHKPGQEFGSTTSAAVTAGQLLEVTGDDTVGPAAAGSIKVVGQAGHDAGSGKPVTIHGPGRPIGEAPVVAAGTTVVAGDRLKAAAAGTVAKYVDGTDAVTLVVGLALKGGAAGALVKYQAR
jgi:hypothetical protein